MASPASVAKHPIHPMLIVFPIGLWIFSLIADIIYLGGGVAAWADVAYYNMIGGIIFALIAAIPGFIDLFSLKPSRPKRIGITHMTLNLVIVVLYIINFYLRSRPTTSYTAPFVLSIIGVAGLLVSGWLGAEIVHVYGISVEGVTSPELRAGERKPERTTTGVNIRP